jgi:glycosyltransferase involved in cell wall biosynthesis
MKILWHSTAPWSPSSYSVLTARAVPNIVKAGHKIAIGTWYGLQGQPLPWTIQDRKTGEQIGRVDVFPAGDGAAFSQDILVKLYKYVKAQVAIVCSDVWPFKKEVTKDILFCPWLPVDHDPAPPLVLNALETAVYPMVYSEWGQRVLADANIKAAHIPCSAPGDVFKPGNKKKAREALGIIDKAKFIVGVIAANKDPQDRKGLAENMQAFAKFSENHDGAYMYLHTDINGPIAVLDIAQQLGIRNRIIQCDPLGYILGMLDTAYMVNAYNACDVLLNLAKSEGFGLPILEAQMCGVPVIATNFSTTDEMLWAGWKIAGQKYWSPGLDSWRLVADIDSATEALEQAYGGRNNKSLQQKGRRGALSLDTDRVFEKYWKPALAEIERIIEGGRKAHDFARSFDGKVPTQPFSGPADRIVPEEIADEMA